MAKAIGCNFHTLEKTEFYKELVIKEPHRKRTKGSTPRAVSLTDATLAKAEQSTEPDPLDKLIAAENEKNAIQRVNASGMGEDEKQATIDKLKNGEMTPQQAIDIADMHPPTSCPRAGKFKSL